MNDYVPLGTIKFCVFESRMTHLCHRKGTLGRAKDHKCLVQLIIATHCLQLFKQKLQINRNFVFIFGRAGGRRNMLCLIFPLRRKSKKGATFHYRDHLWSTLLRIDDVHWFWGYHICGNVYQIPNKLGESAQMKRISQNSAMNFMTSLFHVFHDGRVYFSVICCWIEN